MAGGAEGGRGGEEERVGMRRDVRGGVEKGGMGKLVG